MEIFRGFGATKTFCRCLTLQEMHVVMLAETVILPGN
jgi:hypothetical protein